MKKSILALFTLLVFSTILRAQTDTTHINKDLQLIHLQDSIFIHQSWVNSQDYGRFSCNGLLIIRKGEAVMIDSPMSNEQTKQLCEFLDLIFQVKIKAHIASHYHQDCIGGLDYLHSINAKSLACQATIDKCMAEGITAPTIGFDTEYDCQFNNEPIECRFFGAGHSFDNITIWLPRQQLLFGGCMVKSASSKGLGNLADASLEEWDITLDKVQYAYPEANIVVPGHGNWGGLEIINHTIDLIKSYQMQKNK